jgi:hypothetical protein
VHERGWRTSPVGAIHAGDFKLMEFFETGAVELYNLRDDIGEKRNLAAQSPAKVQELRAKLAAWRQQIGAQMPTMKTDADREADKAAARAEPKAGKKGKKRQAAEEL